VANRPASPAVTKAPRYCSRLSPEHCCTSCDPRVTERYPTIVITDDADGLYTTGNPRPDLLRCQLPRAPPLLRSQAMCRVLASRWGPVIA
jgi:hypothetical protein